MFKSIIESVGLHVGFTNIIVNLQKRCARE